MIHIAQAKSDTGQRYHGSLSGYVIRNELRWITLFQNTPKERQIQVGVVVLSDKPRERDRE